MTLAHPPVVSQTEWDAALVAMTEREKAVAARPGGAWKLISSRRPLPSGVSTIALSVRTPSSPTTRSTQPPSTCHSPCGLSPSSTKNAVAAATSSTMMPTCFRRWIAMHSTVATRPQGGHVAEQAHTAAPPAV